MEYVYQFPMRAAGEWESWIGERDLADLAATAEEAGFHAVSTTDHPFPSDDWLSHGGHHSLDPFVALSFMASATSRLRLMTTVLVAEHRNPYLTAKSVASLDLLSKGRTIVGVGAGYLQAELTALGGALVGRGARFDESIDAMRDAWSGGVVTRSGPNFPVSSHRMLPQPSQRPGPPLWIGGNSAVAQRRVTARGDGWIPFEQSDAMSRVTGTPRLDVETIGERILDIGTARVASGRPRQFEVCLVPRKAKNSRTDLDRIHTMTAAWSSSGVTHISIGSLARSMDACLAEIEALGRELVSDGR